MHIIFQAIKGYDSEQSEEVWYITIDLTLSEGNGVYFSSTKW
jgi:hypothetical protein